MQIAELVGVQDRPLEFLGVQGLALPGIGLFFAVAPAAGSLPSPSGLLLPAIVIVALVLINAVFVAAEFAIAGVRDTEL